MKMKLVSAAIFTSMILINQVHAENFAARTGNPTILRSAELQYYVQTVSSYHPETATLALRQQNIINYYKKVHILKTVIKHNDTIDCIPFAEQPALIDDPSLAQHLLPTVTQQTYTNILALKKLGQNFDFNPATECPLGSVAILRPLKQALTDVAANQKVAPGTPAKSLASAGYAWEQGLNASNGLISTPAQSSFAYFQGPQNQSIPAGNSNHSLEQFWLLQENSAGTFSVEFGLISSSYFTSTPSTSIFTYASIDNYGSKSCYNLLCANFVQFPGSPVLGSPIANKAADYVFQVVHTVNTTGTSGYYLSLGTNNATSSLVGYYPQSLYATANQPINFSVGAEVYATPGDGTMMYGNYVDPCPEFTAAKHIGLISQNGNTFASAVALVPAPFNTIWKFGQKS